MTFYAPLSSVPCRECVPSTCVCEPDEEMVTCEDCLVDMPGNEIAQCGYCDMVVCLFCRDANGVCCRGDSDPDDWYAYLPCHGG
jgi:hypothetical protein